MEGFSVTKFVVSIILSLVILFGVCWVTGCFGLLYDKTIGVEEINIQREKFENSTSHINGAISDLAKYKYEFETEKDIIAKKAIIDLIISKYSDIPLEKINETTVKKFVRDVRNGVYNNLEGK